MCAVHHTKVQAASTNPQGICVQKETNGQETNGQETNGNGSGNGSGSRQPLHRIGQIRSQQDVSVRALARKMNLSANQVRMQEDPNCDISLSSLYRWQQALNVPAAELLVEPGEGLSSPIQIRARLLRMMKTIATLLAEPQSDRTTDMIENLKTEILAVMPEVEHVDRWHGCSTSRDGRDVAAAVLRQIDDALLMDE